MTSLRDEIANQFHECMGYHEGICVPDHTKGHRAIDYADKVLKLIEKRLDSMRPIQIEDREYTKRDMHYLVMCVMEDVKTELFK